VKGISLQCTASSRSFQAHAELRGYFWMKDRLESEAIII
jgi:hypothetical protein